MSTVQQALMAREERKKKEQQEGGQDKVTTALNKRKLRLESTLKDSLADLQNRINEEVTAYNSISKPDFGSGSLKNTLDYTRQSRVNLGNLVKEAESYRKYLGDEKTNDLVALLDSMQKGYGSLLDTARLYEYFKSEEDFNYWKNKESFIKEYMENPEQALKSDSYEESWVKEAEQRAATNTALQAEDFEHYSKLGESIENPTYEDAQGWLSLGGWHPFGEDVGNIVTFSRENKDRVAEQLALSGRVPSSYDVVDYDTYQMTQDEVSAYNYYLAKYGKDKAEEYLEGLRKTLRERAEGIGLLSFSELAKEHPVLASAWSVGTNLFSGPEYLINLFREDDTRYATAQTQVIRQTVSEKVDWEIGNWDAFDFLYNTGMSAIDSAAATALFGKFGGVALGLSAAASATNEALDRGLSNKQAFWTGLFAGVFEGLFETVSIGNFNSLKQGVSTGLKSISKNVAKSMLVNASEETFTEIANIVYDTIANGDLSNYEILVRRYMEQGISETEAKKKAAIDLALQVTEAGASGALMGFGFGAVGGVSQIYNASKIGEKTYGGYAKELIDEALEIDPENPLAKKLQKKLENQKNPSGASLYTLAQQNEETMVRHDLEKISRAVEQRLIELGEKGDVRAISAVLAKKAAGEKLKASEKNALKKSSFGEQVLKELDPEKIRSGEQASSFAEKIGTERINAEEYGRLLDAAEAAQERNISEEDHFLDEEQKSVQGAQSKVFKASPSSVIENKQAKDGSSNALKTEEAEDEPSVKKNKAEKKIPTLLELSEKYGAQAGAMVHTYISGQNPEEYDTAYRIAYDMGKSGVDLSYALKSQGTSYLTENQRELAYEAGKDASDISAREREEKNRKAANGNTGRRKGILKGDGVTVSELQKSFNDTQKIAYKLLSAYAEATGIDIVLYKSEANQDGVFEGAQGRFEWKENTIYLDINAGLSYAKDMNELAKYTMLRTFSHEFTHFIEKWNPLRYNEFRKLVFATLTEHGENVDGLIEKKKNLDTSGRMTYEEASREVVAEAMTDILPDSDFLRDLAQNHKSIFEKLLEKLKEFKERLRDYFNTIGLNPSREANALKEQLGDTVKYFDSIVRMFDRIALEAVENYQQTVAMEEVKSEAAAEVKASEYDHFTITDDAEGRVLSILFDGKPTDAVREVLKANAFVWNKKKGEWFRSGKWYNRSRTEDVVSALQKAYEAEAPAKKQEEAKAPEAKDAYSKLSEILSVGDLYKADGRTFSVSGNDKDGYYAAIKRDAEQNGAYSIANARDLIWQSRFATRQEAVADLVGVARNNDLLTPKEEIKQTIREGNSDGREEAGTVLQHRSDGEGASRLLAEVETEAVQGTEAEGDLVADTGERRDETGRHDLGADAERHERGHGEGSGESRDLRRDDELTSKEAEKKAEALHTEVEEQIAKKSTEQPKGRNFVIGDSLNLPSGEKARYKANVEAIRLVKKLEAEGRYATEAEQELLSKYIGWGGLANAFDERKSEWSKEFRELKELLTDEEYASARASTLNAHYTDISVIKAMYDGLSSLGFTGGRMLEPSSGVGNFVGAMPANMSSKVKSWTMVELDGITGRIAKYLYPNADVRIEGFEKANIPDNFMDVAIGNVPFGNYSITDKAYPKKVTSAIHNYFFAKSLDKVRPGGIVMFITSSYTMNSKDETVRRYIMGKADLLGAIRLPDNAFKGNAGTEVVTDILILKKREAGKPYAGVDFLEAPLVYPVKGSYNGAQVNSYFEAHPEMVLGTPVMEGGMYRSGSLTYKAFPDKGSLADQIREAFTHIEGKMEYPAVLSKERTNFAVERADKKTKQNGLVVKDGRVYQNSDGVLTEKTVSKDAAERIKGLLSIRDAAKELMFGQQQGLKESEIKKARTALNKAYDDFVKKNGYINAPRNRNAIKDDPEKFSLFALENYNPDTKKGSKADIFYKNTIAPNRTVTYAKDVFEGLIVSRNENGGVDLSLISRLTGKSEDAVRRELLDSRQVFLNRDGELEAAEVYLSGNVRAKLREAKALVPMDADYQKNVEALESVMPKDVPYHDIFVNPGTPWIPASVYSDFAAYMLGGHNSEYNRDVEVTRNNETGNFTVELKRFYLKTSAANTQKWGTSKRSFLDLFDAMLNSRSVVVRYKTDDGHTVVDKDATAAANEKLENITKEFQDWLWRDEKRRNELSMLYNETFNAIVTPKYNGDNLTVNGANAMKPLRPHQRNAVQRVISSGGNTLLAHKVGAGKTYEMAAAAMKLKQLGLVKKPLFAVPKSLVAQWGNEFMDFFPTAKLLVAEETDFTAENRKVFANRIATGDYDAVIVSYEQFEKLPISNDFARALYEEQINAVIDAIEEAKAEKGGKAPSVKDLEKKRKSLQEKMKKLSDVQKDEDNIEFEQLGVDSLFIDEAHNFKNLFYTTSMTNVSGLGNKDGSKRAFDLYTKVRYLQKLNGGKGIVFATATPVMNSMSEMYIMQKYLQPDLLDQLGLSTFDAWAKQFGEVVNGVEIKPNGQGYRVKQSFSRFKNISELQLLFRSFADVLTDIPELKIPKMKGGKVNVVVCEPGQFQKEYMKELEKRADNIKNVDPSVDNMLKITSDGRKISYTQRMIDPSLPYEEGCKIYRCSDNVVRVYNDSRNIKGTQLIFCDMATPKSKSKSESADTDTTDTDMENARLYDDIRERLVEGGIPAKEIAFIHEADTDQKKKKLFSDMNDGNVRVLIGSTGKMGVGMNAQKRVVAIHHLDAPWRPGDVEQRNGRAFRQGNINEEVSCFTYVTEGSFDARLWDILERKQNFINQVMNGENVGREAEDTGEVTLSAAEVKALASGSPLILEQVQLDTDIKKLESLYRAHNASVRSAKERLVQDRGRIAALEEYISAGKEDATATVDTFSEGKFSITVGKKKYTEKKSAGIALMAEATAKAVESGYTDIGSFAGFQLLVVKTHEGIRGLLKGKQGYAFNTYPGNTTYMVNHLIGVVEGIPETVNQWESELEYAKKDCFEQEKLIAEPFSKATELEEKRARYIEVMEILNPKEEQQLGSMEEDAVQEQSREYLESEEKYSYEWFVHKPDMEVTEVDDRVKYSRSDIVSLALKNAASVGYTNENGNAVVYVEDMDTDVIVPKTLYQQRQNTLTDREVLEFAASQLESSELSEGERDALGIFRSRLEALKVLQEKRAEQGRLYKEQQFGAKVDRKAAEETLNRMHILDDQIKRADANVLSVENKEVFKRVLQKARRIVEVAQRKHDDEKIARWIDRRNNASAIRKYRERLREDTEELKSWILHPDNKDIVKHVPDVLKASVIPFLKSIDFTSKRALAGGNPTKADEVFIKDLNALQSALKKNLDTEGLYSGYNDLPPDFMYNLNHLIQTVETLTKNNSGEFVINQMTSEELKELSKVVRVLKTYIKQTNSFLSNAMFEHVYDAGDSSIVFMSRLNTAKHTGKASEFLLWKQIRPAYAFERFGKGGVSIYDGLRRGQATLAFNTKEIKEFAEKAYTAKEVEEWSKVKTVSLGGEQTVKMRISQIMSFYELYKQEDSKRHILDGGIRISTFKDGGKKISDNGHTLNEGEAERIIGLLTPRQKEVADKLQKYMQDKGSRWGNDVSVKRFGEELFGEENYFPINSDGRHLQTSNEEHPSAASLYALLNMSFTKSRNKEANNRIVIYDIFDVFSNHMASMAQYNALALPVLDAVKWLNYRQVSVNEDGSKTVLGSVREQMAKAFGVPEETRPGSGNRGYAEEFVLNIIKAFNGTEAQGVSSDTAGLNSLRRYNMAQVAYNFRVVLQQPLAITRAGLLIDYSSILKGLTLKPAAIKKNIEEMQRYSGIAAWKSLGFYDVNISRGLSEIIKHKSTVLNKIGELGMWGAEKADLLTWSAMWSACKEEVIRKQSLTPKSDGFYEAVTELFEDVIYKTQVVDSVLTKNEFLRSKGFFARAVGSFMSEPTATASMVIDAFDKYNMDLKRGMTKTQAWSKNGKKIGRTVAVYSISAIMLATVQAVADALRDDDDYESFLEKFLEAFAGDLLDEMIPLNKLPILSDFYELAKVAVATWTGLDVYGNTPQTVFMQWYDSLVKGMDILHDKIWGEDTNYSWYGGIYKLLQAASGISGLPMAAVTREIVTAWNNTIGAMAPSLQVKTYEPSELSKIRYAYEDGYLTFVEATRELLRQGLVETQEEAYFTIQGWEYGEGYSRYQKIYDAVRNGGDFEGAMKELTSHGYKEKEVLSKVKGQIGTWYKDGQITKQQAIDMLSKYFNMDSYEITADVNRWSCKVVTGIEYTEIKDEFLQGNITAARAVEMRMRYGGETKENATATVNKWRAEKETGIEYNSIEQAFFDGKISKADAKNMYITYGGFSEEKANEKVTVLDFSKKHPQLEANDLTFSMVRAYNTYCESTGVGVKVFYEAWAYKNSVSGSKESTMLYIDRLPLTAVQKDSLYYAFGWAESKIFEAPWH